MREKSYYLEKAKTEVLLEIQKLWLFFPSVKIYKLSYKKGLESFKLLQKTFDDDWYYQLRAEEKLEGHFLPPLGKGGFFPNIKHSSNREMRGLHIRNLESFLNLNLEWRYTFFFVRSQ